MSSSSQGFEFKVIAELSKDQLKGELSFAYAEIHRLNQLQNIATLIEPFVRNVDKQLSGLAKSLTELSTLGLGGSIKGFSGQIDQVITKLDSLPPKISDDINARCLVTVNDHLKNLDDRADVIIEKLDALDNSMNDTVSVKSETWAEKASKNRNPMTPDQQLAMQRAAQDAHEKIKRQSNVVITKLPENRDAFKEDLKNTLNLPAETNFLWLGPKEKPTALLIKTSEKAIADKILKNFYLVRQVVEKNYKNVSIRPDYTSTELNVYRAKWAEVIERNNKENAYKWTVRGLSIIEIPTPRAWRPKEVKAPQ